MQDPIERLNAALEGRYRIERRLGEGGMASVYLAEDLKHERSVAVKVLKPELAAVIGGERFITEIKTTANLQHPHILPLFDSGEADGFLYYVMPFVDGESLRDRLNREKQLPVDEAVRITVAVASALQYAHEHDIVHRDIKPENILMHAGQPVVADFGIALAVSAAGGGRLTETGLSLGTPHYMSPEQATADRDLSPRSDVYSLACVLYEMLAADPPHAGSSAQAVLMRILTEEARPITEVRRSVPPNVGAALARALEKLPADRFESAEAFAKALEDAAYTYVPPARTEPLRPAVAAAGPARPGVPIWAAAVTAALLLAVGYAISRATDPTPPAAPMVEFTITGDATHTVSSPCCGRAVAMSPVGDRVVYQAFSEQDGTLLLYQRRLDQRQAQVIPGTRGAHHPFFSPDGEWIGYFSGAALYKVRFDGGTPLTILSGLPVTGRVAGAAWAPDNSIIYATQGNPGLRRVSADGGHATTITVADSAAGELNHMWPHVLPDGETVLFTVRGGGGTSSITFSLAATPIDGGGHRVLGPGADPRFVEPGTLVYEDGAGSIMAQPFDPKALETRGSRFRIADGVTWRTDGMAEYDISRNGTLVYRLAMGNEGAESKELVLVDMRGNEETLASGEAFRYPRFSRDGRYIAYEVEGDEGGVPDDIWVWDTSRRVPIRVTFDADNSVPVWSPDGSELFYQTPEGIMRRAWDGSGETALLQAPPTPGPPYVDPAGRWLLWFVGENRGDIWVRPLDGSAEGRPLLSSPFFEVAPAVSPDGRWIAYQSSDSGTPEVYVEPFPDLGRRFKVSTGGGYDPVWSHDGRRLFYVREGNPDSLVAVDVRAGDAFDVGAPTSLFDMAGFVPYALGPNFDLHPDNDRWVFVRGEAEAAATSGDIHVVIMNALAATAGNGNDR